MPQDYNSTLNLPKTDFPMRASLPKREPDMLKDWYDLDLYHKMVDRNEGKPRFILHDGPPFSNGYIHMGTVLNKCIKDFIVRYKSMSGWQAKYVPGWDNHGMPIESAIIKQNKLDRKSMTIPEFRDACAEFASKYVDIQREQFKRLGVVGEWDDPYLTMAPRFEAIEVKVFGKMYEKGYIYRGKKPVYWCAHDETALAEAEIEYENQNVESLYVKFPIADDLGKLSGCGELNKMFFVIWTTTTWTIPGNLAICLGEDIDYALALTPDGEIYVIAEKLLPDMVKAAELPELETLAVIKGREFEFMKAKHPLYDRESIVILGDHVTIDAGGTGCVHTAPGHGMEDFDVCRRYDASGKTNIGVIVPVDDHGHMNTESGKYEGLYYEKANKVIRDDLKDAGLLLAAETLSHQYPHCWRCKKPVLYRATDQWFCSVDAFKDDTIRACGEVEWLPSWGHDRMVSMVRERDDWCISRQRNWGLPIPVFYCEDCGEVICTEETINRISDIFAANGSNAWFSMDVNELLPESFTCPKCGGAHFRRPTDTLDCWFDSGSSHFACVRRRDPDEWPSTMYLEGADQFRGWFQSSLLTSVACEGIAPYKIVLTHGWTVDGDGRQMHKSLGNGVYPEEVIPKYGADILRLWSSASDYHSDVRCSDRIFTQLSDIYLKIRNTARFILGNLDGFDPDTDAVPFERMIMPDRWAMVRLGKLIDKVRNAYENYEFHTVIHSVHNFCVVDMSSFYLDIIKDRLYCEGKDSFVRKSGQSAMYVILDAVVRLIAPILAFTSNEIWLEMPHHKGVDTTHVMFNDMPDSDHGWTFEESEERHWELALKLRSDVNKALEFARAEKLIGKPLDAKVTLCVSDDAEDFELIRDHHFTAAFIVSEVAIVYGEGEGYVSTEYPGVTIKVEPSTEPKCVRCWTHSSGVGGDAEHPELCPRCAAAVSGN